MLLALKAPGLSHTVLALFLVSFCWLLDVLGNVASPSQHTSNKANRPQEILDASFPIQPPSPTKEFKSQPRDNSPFSVVKRSACQSLDFLWEGPGVTGAGDLLQGEDLVVPRLG